MKRIATLLVIVAVAGLVAVPVQGNELTLKDCIDLALKNRASIIRARGTEAQLGASKRAALGEFLPQVRASYGWSKGKETDIKPDQWRDTEYGVGVDTFNIGGDDYYAVYAYPTDSALYSQPDQDIGPRKSWNISADINIISIPSWFNLAAANAQLASGELNVLASEQDLIYAVKVSYYAYLANVENLTVQEEAVKRADEQLKLIESRFELGSASKSDVLKQKVQFGNDRLALLRAENNVTNAHANLAYTIGLDPRQDHQFATGYGNPPAYTGSLDEAISYGLENNPGLLSVQKSVDQAQHSLKSVWSSYLPTVSAYANYQKFDGTQAYPVVFDYSSNTKSWGFTVSLNIFDGFYREKRVTDAKVSLNNSRADLADGRNATVTEIKTAYLEIEQFQEQRGVSQENVAAADEDLKITQEKYNLGAATILDLLDAQVSVKQAQVSLIQADLDFNLAVAKLEKAMGRR